MTKKKKRLSERGFERRLANLLEPVRASPLLPASGCFFEEAMCEWHALGHECEPTHPR